MFQSTSKSNSSEYNNSEEKVNKNRIYIADGNRYPPAPTSNTPTQLFVDEEEETKQKKTDKELQAKTIQRSSNEEEVQMKESPSKGGQTKLPDDVRSKMEGSFGADLSSVNIHTNDERATQMGALAYTQGEDVHFAPGQYNPSSTKGQELIGHELTHTIQQRQGRVKPDAKQNKGGANINSDKGLEKEADEMGALAAQGKMADVSGSGSGVQMQENPVVAPEQENSVNATVQEPEPAQQTLDQKIENGVINAVVNADEVKFYHNSVEVGKTRSISGSRRYIVRNYNWSGVVKLMNYIASQTGSFTYTVPENLDGNSNDDSLIIPDNAIKYLMLLQLNYLVDNNSNAYGSIDGQPGGGTIGNIIAPDMEVAASNNKESTYMNQDSDDLAAHTFSQNIADYDGSTNAEDMYNELKDLVQARNGLWSTKDRIVNIVAIKQEEGSRNEQGRLITNDYFFVAYKNGETYEVKKYIGSADPGNVANGMVMPNQTTSLKPGFHKGYQTGAKIGNIVRKRKNTTDVNSYRFDKGSGMNHHKANSKHNLFYRNSNNNAQKYYRLKDIGQYKSEDGWLYKDGDNFKSLGSGTVEYEKVTEVTANKEYTVKHPNEESGETYTLVVGSKSRLQVGDEATNLVLYKGLTDLQRTMINHGKKYDDLTDAEKTEIDNLITEIVAELGNAKIVYGNESGEESSAEVTYKTQLERYVRENIWGSDDGYSITEDVAPGFSHGCQVFSNSKEYYSYLNEWQQFALSDEESEKTDQDRWYYTIVDIETLNITSTEEITTPAIENK